MAASTSATADEMRLFDIDGNRLYLNADERARFLAASADEAREDRALCHLLHYTGCRPSEALAVAPSRVDIAAGDIVVRTLKKRKHDREGRKKAPQYRVIPVPEEFIERLDWTFDLRRRQRKRDRLDEPLWSISRTTTWRLIKRVMDRAGIEGPQATPKGLRHAFGIAMLSGERPAPLSLVRDLMGHSDTKTTEIYLQVIGFEKRRLVMQAWD